MAPLLTVLCRLVVGATALTAVTVFGIRVLPAEAARNERPTIPVLVSPADGELTKDQTPTLVWEPAADPEGSVVTYRLQVSSDTDFIPRAVKESRLLLTVFTPTAPLSNGRWYWRVRAEDARHKKSAYASVKSFTIDTSAPAPAPAGASPVSSPSGSGEAGGEAAASQLVSVRAQKKVRAVVLRKRSRVASYRQSRFPPVVRSINVIFRGAYGRSPTFAEWAYWANRLLRGEKKSAAEISGAMRWAARAGSRMLRPLVDAPRGRP